MTHQPHGTACLLPAVDIGRVIRFDLHCPEARRTNNRQRRGVSFRETLERCSLHSHTNCNCIITRKARTRTSTAAMASEPRSVRSAVPRKWPGHIQRRESATFLEKRDQYYAAAHHQPPFSRSNSRLPKPPRRQIIPKRRDASMGGQPSVSNPASLPFKRNIYSLETKGNETEDRDEIRLKRFKRTEDSMQAGIYEKKAKETALKGFPCQE